MLSYEPLWKSMKEKGVTQYKRIKEYRFSAGQLSRLRANHYVNTHTIEVLCEILECNVQDILVYKKNETDT